jgi:hypothetical protein
MPHRVALRFPIGRYGARRERMPQAPGARQPLFFLRAPSISSGVTSALVDSATRPEAEDHVSVGNEERRSCECVPRGGVALREAGTYRTSDTMCSLAAMLMWFLAADVIPVARRWSSQENVGSGR